jgi:hypothetical protein
MCHAPGEGLTMPRRADSPAPPTLANYRGSEAYRAALGELASHAGADNLCELIDLALADLAEKHRVTLPTRTRPVGWNRHSKPEEGLR